MTTALERAILGRDTSEPEPHPHGTIVEGEVWSVSSEGMEFRVPDWDDGKFVFGPAPWPESRVEPTVVGPYGNHDHAETLPSKGDRCLVVFVGEGVSNPWVVQTWPK